MIKHVRIQNYKSLTDVSVDLDPITVLIGRSGTGKTNFVEALRWLRDCLKPPRESHDLRAHFIQTKPATMESAPDLRFEIKFEMPGYSEEFLYLLCLGEKPPGSNSHLLEEKLLQDNRTLFHQKYGKWLAPAFVGNRTPGAGAVSLGCWTGFIEIYRAHNLLTNWLGCYTFPDNVFVNTNRRPVAAGGFEDDGSNSISAYVDINDDPTAWSSAPQILSAMNGLKSTLKSIDLRAPTNDQIQTTHEVSNRLQTFDIGQESEGFRRLLAILIALYQRPPKLTLIFDEPEKGIYPWGLAILAEEFKTHASKGRGQVVLTTHSPEFLNYFAPENIRVVEMHDYQTMIGTISPEQMESLREHYLAPKELLTVDEARIKTLCEAP